MAALNILEYTLALGAHLKGLQSSIRGAHIERIRTMSHLLRAVAALLFFIPFAAGQSKVESVLDLPEFVHDWEISKQFTIDVANAMPAELYSFKPNPEEMTFGVGSLLSALPRAVSWCDVPIRGFAPERFTVSRESWLRHGV